MSAWAHSHGIRLLCYLDDWLVLFSSEREAKQSVQSLLSLCRTLGVVINKKSDLVPSQTVKYLGMTINTEAGKVFPSLVRVKKFLTVVENICTMDAPLVQLWQVILGHLASLERLVPHRCLRMRTLQWHLKEHWSPESDPPSLPVPLPREVRRDLSWWMVRDHLLTGVRFGAPALDLHLYSDASCSGWGAHLLDQHVSMMWSDQEKLLHINPLEMKALFLGLQAFREDVIGHHVTVMCDNSTVVAYVNKQGGTASRALCLLTSLLLRWTESFDIHLGRVMSVFWHRKCSSYWPLPRLSILVSSTLCRIVSLIPGTGVRCPFLSSWALWQRLRIPLPLLLGLRAYLYQPYETREIITMGDCYVLCGGQVLP